MLKHQHPFYEPDLWIHQPLCQRLWGYVEFSHVALGDERLNRRLKIIAGQFAEQPLANIPQACGNWARSKAAYRFFSNPKVNFADILKAHQQATCQRIKPLAVVLCPQDTTSLNYTPHATTQGLGPIGNRAHTPLGFLVHSTVAVSPAGEMLGVLQCHCWARPRRQRKKKHRNKLPLSKKESNRWLESFRQLQSLALSLPTTRLVSVADREADLYELLELALAPDNPVGLLVRMQHDRQIQAKKKSSLFKALATQPVAGPMIVNVPRQGTAPARKATLEVRKIKVTLLAPLLKSQQAPLTLWAVEAREVDAPAGATPILWRLLSSLPVETLAQAKEKIEWYACRWTIEELHRVLKSGCQVEARQLGTRARLERTLAVDIVVAWKVLSLSRAARFTPDAPASQWLRTEEWQALSCYWNQTRQVPKEQPTIAEATKWIACLGGFLARVGDGFPGVVVLWRGLHRLKDITEAWLRFGSGGSQRGDPRRPRRAPIARANKANRCG